MISRSPVTDMKRAGYQIGKKGKNNVIKIECYIIQVARKNV